MTDDTQRLQNDPAKNTNQRLPPLHLPGKYPYVTHTEYRSGNWKREDSTPNNESISHGHVTGTFQEHTVLGGFKTLVANCSHHYTTGGSTHTSDQNIHNKTGGSKVHQVGTDQYEEHFNHSMQAVGQNVIKANGGTRYQHTTGKVEVSSTEDHVTDFNDGNHHFNVAGDHVQYTGNNLYNYVGGEKGTYLPKGNYDISLDKGKFQVLAKGDIINIQSAKDITIQSDTKITLKVGSSTIVISPNKIVITSGEVDFGKA